MARADILIVEDDPNLLEGIKAILELEEYRVLAAENGMQALRLLREAPAPPDLIVSDIMMPHMDGIQFLTEVRKQDRWLAVPFIFLTAKSDKMDMQRGKRLGVDDYLVKPFDADDLLVAIESRLKRHRALNEARQDTVNSIKRNILTILNHEFRTPLTFIVAYADLLNNHDPGNLADEDMLQFLRGVGSGATRLRRLIENFILLVELETGDAKRTFEWRRSAIDNVPDLLAEVCERALAIYGGERECRFEIARDLPVFVGDCEYLSLALTQLVVNALKFSPPETPILVGARATGAEMHLWVRDFGRGIAAAEMDAIWDTFYQINREHYEDQGAGAGLAIVRGITELHGGRVTVESEFGVGSTFTVSLPLEPRAAT